MHVHIQDPLCAESTVPYANIRITFYQFDRAYNVWVLNLYRYVLCVFVCVSNFNYNWDNCCYALRLWLCWTSACGACHVNSFRVRDSEHTFCVWFFVCCVCWVDVHSVSQTVLWCLYRASSGFLCFSFEHTHTLMGVDKKPPFQTCAKLICYSSASLGCRTMFVGGRKVVHRRMRTT